MSDIHRDPQEDLSEPLPAWPADDELVESEGFATAPAVDLGSLEPAVSYSHSSENSSSPSKNNAGSWDSNNPKRDFEFVEAPGVDGVTPEPVVEPSTVWEPEKEVESRFRAVPKVDQVGAEALSLQEREDGEDNAGNSEDVLGEGFEDDELPDLPGAVVWAVSGVLNDDGEFLSKMELKKRPPRFAVSSDDTSAEVVLTPIVTKRLLEALAVVDDIYEDGESLFRRKKREPRSFSERVTAVVDWWFDHKIKGTLYAILSGVVLYGILGGFVTMFLKG